MTKLIAASFSITRASSPDTVAGWLIKGTSFAVDERYLRDWIVTHLPSGLSISYCSAATRRTSVARAAALHKYGVRIGVKWSRKKPFTKAQGLKLRAWLKKRGYEMKAVS